MVARGLSRGVSHSNHALSSRRIFRPTVRNPSQRLLVKCSASQTLVKICGVTNPDDAAFAAKCGADFIGMIMWPKAKRYVPPDTAAKISEAAMAHGAKPIGVFVDESPEKILDVCKASNVSIAQLHGEESRRGFRAQDFPDSLETVYVLHATPDGRIQTELPGKKSPNWLLVDSLKGGSGASFDWDALEVPEASAKVGWLLAGGLKPENVGEAVKVAHPTGVDVSSGVCGEDGLLKDPQKVKMFIDNAQGRR